jgi:hypothetical protein
MSNLYQSLSHSKWDCKYHVVFIPKRQRKVLFGRVRQHLGRSSTLWPGRRSARLSKDICGRTTCISALRFLRSTRWLR